MNRWQVFSAAPHRMMFFAGVLQLLLVMLFWGAELLGRYTPIWAPLNTAIPSTWAHLSLMLYAVFVFFIFGFLMTTYPRWMGGQVVPRQRYARAFLWLTAGVLVYYLGLASAALVAAAGVALLLVGWGVGLQALWAVYRQAPAPDKHYERYLNLALGLGWVGLLSYLPCLLGGSAWWLDLSMCLGVWGFLVPAVVTVSHRMIPYFSSTVLPAYRVVQPAWSLAAFWAGFLAHGVLEFTGLARWLFLVDLPLALLAFYHSGRWGLVRSFQVRLLAVLHLAFLWLGIALTLYGIQSLVLWSSGTWIIGRGPLHALGIGFLTSMVVAMATRVTLGHSGRALVLDHYTWACFVGVSLSALARIAAEVPTLNALGGGHLNLLAALLWIIALALWAGRYAPMYLRARADGRPG
jgi:uncharacterized protein involved in response to NO